MIEIRNLSKIYRASLDKPCTAIDNLTLDLPSTGMVFITGKSGSGKSTLLNMIGTLDNISRGDIYVESRSVKKFTDKEAQEYRSSYLGFIFQDFLLLDELTVKENIELALNISGITDEQVFKDIIKRVDLEGKEDKFPNELSGGQRQRVAIARALIKNPKMLLCDEPTGNLDQRTSRQIFNILKEESKTKLVIVVSHNLIDAENFADRIIELFEGKILHDYTKTENYNNEFTETENYVILPHHKDLTNKELQVLNHKVQNQKFRIAQNKGGFYNTKEVPIQRGEFELSSSHLSKKNKIKLSSMFFRKNKHGAPYIILMTTLLISLFYIFQVFIAFDGNRSLESDNDPDNFIKISTETEKGTLSESRILYVTDSDLKEYEENGFNDYHKLYNWTLNFRTSMLDKGSFSRFGAMINYNYITETFGTLECDQEYLTKLFGNKNNELDIVAGDLTNATKKMIITDYTADAILANTKKGLETYDDVLKSYKNYVCAIVNTGYKEKYAKVIEDGINAKNEKIASKDYLEMYSDDKDHNDFYGEVNRSLGISYTFSTNIYEDFNMTEGTKSFSCYNVHFESNKKTYFDESITIYPSSKLKDGQIIMNYMEYNEIFDKLLTPEDLKEFKPHKVKLLKYDDNTTNGEVVQELEFEIISLSSTTYVSTNDYKELAKYHYMPYGVYFDNIDNYDKLVKTSSSLGYFINDVDTGVVPVIYTVLSLFKGFCVLIIGLLFIASFLHIVFYGVNSIRKNIYEIGVLKALGAKSFDIAIIFITQITIIGVALALTSILGIYLSSIVSDNLLIGAFEDFLTITIFELDIIGYNLDVMGIDILIAFVLTIVSSFVPLIYLKSIKPLNILKGRNK